MTCPCLLGATLSTTRAIRRHAGGECFRHRAGDHSTRFVYWLHGAHLRGDRRSGADLSIAAKGVQYFEAATAPFVFTSFKSALNYTATRKIDYLRVGAHGAGRAPSEVKAGLRRGSETWTSSTGCSLPAPESQAIGASNAYVYLVIVQQAVWSALAGYGLGRAMAFGVIR